MISINTDSNSIYTQLKSLPEDTVIGEFSGRDSVAAILKALENPQIKHILPIASFAGTEYGDTGCLESNYDHLKSRISSLYGKEKTLHTLTYYSNPSLWWVLNGRYTSLLIQKYGFFVPCIGCHAYFHILRVPFALKLSKKLISGERISHDGKIKINQLEICLDYYKKILNYFDVDLLLPIMNIREGKQIEALIGSDWEEGKNHPECVYSANYRDTKGCALYDEEMVLKFLEEFLYPACLNLTQVLIENPHADKTTLLQSVEAIL